MQDNANNKRIAQNTLLLYIRMFITMAVGLYTSRVVLRVLGVSDYGIYNVVGGVITMISFLNSAMVAASQRYLSYELGTGVKERLSKVFSTSVLIHLAICIIAVIVGETIGLWFVNEKMNIPYDRLNAANWVYQASILTFVINVMSVPYNSAIVAHERMSAFAYISIVEAVLKLLIVYILIIIPYDKLIIYSILMVCVGTIIRMCYTIYCRKNFFECKFKIVYDRKIFMEMFSFAGWSILGNMGFTFKDQISNIILNLFYGTTVNAARGIGMQVTAIVKTFATNFTMAMNPQIIKQYAEGNIDASRKLVYAGSRYSFYLLCFVSIPIIINVDYILKLWLGDVPKFTNYFCCYSLLVSLLFTLSGCVTTAIQATGKVKLFQIGLNIILLSELPFAWILMELDYPPYAVMYPSVLTYTIAVFFRFFLIRKYVMGYKLKDYIIEVICPCVIVFVSSFLVSSTINFHIGSCFLNFLFSSVASLFIVLSFVLVFGIKQKERIALLKTVKKYFKI